MVGIAAFNSGHHVVCQRCPEFILPALLVSSFRASGGKTPIRQSHVPCLTSLLAKSLLIPPVVHFSLKGVPKIFLNRRPHYCNIMFRGKTCQAWPQQTKRYKNGSYSLQAFTQETGLSSVTHKSSVITFLNGPFLQIERKICDMNFFLSIVSIELYERLGNLAFIHWNIIQWCCRDP